MGPALPCPFPCLASLVSGLTGIVVLRSVLSALLCDPTDCRPPGSFLCPRDSPGENTGVGFHALLQVGDLSNAGIKPTSPTLAGRFSTAELLGELLQWLILAKRRGFGLFLVCFCLGFIRAQSLAPCGHRSENRP